MVKAHSHTERERERERERETERGLHKGTLKDAYELAMMNAQF
jgi:hypothetical protein